MGGRGASAKATTIAGYTPLTPEKRTALLKEAIANSTPPEPVKQKLLRAADVATTIRDYDGVRMDYLLEDAIPSGNRNIINLRKDRITNLLETQIQRAINRLNSMPGTVSKITLEPNGAQSTAIVVRRKK